MSIYQKAILCLANSRRPGGSCVAGKEYAGGKTSAWIRPINTAHEGAISDHDKVYQDNSHAELLDIVQMTLEKPVPHLHHQEDHQIDPGKYWKKTGRATWGQIVNATDTVKGALWSDGDHSFHGRNDKVSEEIAATLKGSLYLIAPTRLDLVVGYESAYQAPDVRRVRADFDYNGTRYNFVVTDPVIEDEYFAKADGSYRVNDARLCISLAEILHGSATKLVAAVITSDRV
jgi:hypothetical protein